MNMIEMEVSKLTTQQLNWAVGLAEGATVRNDYGRPKLIFGKGAIMFDIDGGGGQYYTVLKYSTDWAVGGPIIEQHHIVVNHFQNLWQGPTHDAITGQSIIVTGQTLLHAAMQCFVISKLGNVVTVPHMVDKK